MHDPNAPKGLPRRRALHVLGVCSLALLGAACKDDEPPAECPGAASVDPTTARLRATLEYVDLSVRRDKLCIDCNQWVAAPSPDQCGTCKLVPGPIHPKGTCKVFAPRV